MPRITIINAGFYSSIQDSGRTRYRNVGVPQSGAMDQLAAGYGNYLLNNTPDAAVMEIILKGGTYLFSFPTRVVITGAEMYCSLNGIAIVALNQVQEIKSGDVLTIGKLTTGNFCYLSIAGGFLTDVVLQSRSFYDRITKNSKLQSGDYISYSEDGKYKEKSTLQTQPRYYGALKCFAGPEFQWLDRIQQQQVLEISFTVSKDWNRMAFQVVERIENQLPQLKSSPVLPGTVQLTPSGQLIVLMRDAQVTGGYPRILQLDAESISSLAQKRVGEKVDFIIKN